MSGDLRDQIADLRRLRDETESASFPFDRGPNPSAALPYWNAAANLARELAKGSSAADVVDAIRRGE